MSSEASWKLGGCVTYVDVAVLIQCGGKYLNTERRTRMPVHQLFGEFGYGISYSGAVGGVSWPGVANVDGCH